MTPPRALGILLVLASAAACDDKPAPAPAPSATETSAPAATPAPPPKPTLPPTLYLDKSGALVAGGRVTLEGAGAGARLKAALSDQRAFIEHKEVRVTAERQIPPAFVATMVDALGALGATRVLVHTSTRSEFPAEVGFVPLDEARSAPPCTLIGMITEDRGSAVWSLKGGVAGKRGKGMAGPDLTLTGETLTERAKKCPESKLLVVAGAPGVEWGLLYDLAASTKTLKKAYFENAVVLAGSPVPGRKVELGTE